MLSKEVYFSFFAISEAQVSQNYIQKLMLILMQQHKQEIFRPMTLTADTQEQSGTIWNGKGSTGRFLGCILILVQENILYENVHR
jgi:hypothetical protein